MGLRLANHGQPVQWTQDPDGYTSSTIDTRGVESIKLTSWEGQVLCAKTPRELGRWSSTPPKTPGWYWMRDGDEVEEPVQVLDDGDVLRAGFEFEDAPGSNCSFWSEPLEPPK